MNCLRKHRPAGAAHTFQPAMAQSKLTLLVSDNNRMFVGFVVGEDNLSP